MHGMSQIKAAKSRCTPRRPRYGVSHGFSCSPGTLMRASLSARNLADRVDKIRHRTYETAAAKTQDGKISK